MPGTSLRSRRRVAALCAVTVAGGLGLAGCGLATTNSETAGQASTILLTREFGARRVGGQLISGLPKKSNIVSVTSSSFRVKKTPGGKNVQSIDGVEGGSGSGWSYWLNGIGGHEHNQQSVSMHGGDHLWWDYHDKSATTMTNAVVGQYPEPFQHGADGKRYPVVLQCADDAMDACDTVSDSLRSVGVLASRQALGTEVETETLRLIIGPWSEIRIAQALNLVDAGPESSGVYARFDGTARHLALLDPSGRTAETAGAGTGLVAAIKLGAQGATWVITGTDVAGVNAAAGALEEQRLSQHYAIATTGAGHDTPLPVTAP
ncbi:MAG TPA: hypothetical protein VGM91_14715 [Conexibacter sp.]